MTQHCSGARIATSGDFFATLCVQGDRLLRSAIAHRLSYVRVLGPFVAAIAVLVGLCVGGYQVLSAVRAFVGGESLWSKGRSAAMEQLRRYAVTQSPQAYARFLAALEVPLGDRQAREELDRSSPSFERARAGFLRGGNHPGDVDVLVWLYYGFSGTALMRDAVAAWVEGDRLIAELLETGQQLERKLSAAGGLSEPERAVLLARLDELDGRLVVLEKRFSASLGEASRKTLFVLEAVIVGFAAALTFAVVGFAGRALHRYDKAQRLLAEANQRWTLATAGDGIGLFEWHVQTDELHLDARSSALFGLEAGPEGRYLPRRELRELLHPDDVQAVRTSLQQAATNGTLFKQRYRVRRPDGAMRHIEATGVMQNDGPRAPARMLGVARDVSDEVLRGQLSFEKAAAERVARARIEFLSRLSHELRTPLNAVLGFSQLMLADKTDALSPAATARVRHIAAAGNHLLHLVDDVLDVTKIDSGHLTVHVEPMLLLPALDAAMRLIAKQQQMMGIVIVKQLPSQPLCVLADAQRLEQVFVNLLSNGCKYNRAGGLLTIQHRIDGGSVWLGFRDEGEGLAAQELEQLFQPFKRLTRQPGIEGTGLGLVIVKLLLEQMGGGIEVASVKGQGSTFTVRLPLCETAA